MDWQFKQITIRSFEVDETTSQALARNLIQLLDQYGLKNNVITCVNDEDANLNVITLALKYVVNCKLVWKKTFKALGLTMYFPKHTNRGQQKKSLQNF